MTQHRASKNNNPLSQARGKAKDAANLWFRKSGQGPRCWTAYYQDQPDGTVGDLSTVTCRGTFSSSTLSLPHSPLTTCAILKRRQGAGLSRAAKRRRKKNGGASTSEPNQQQPPTDALSQSEPSTTTPATHQSKPSSPSSQTTSLLELVRLTKPLPVTCRLRHTADPTLLADLQARLSQPDCINLVVQQRCRRAIAPCGIDKDDGSSPSSSSAAAAAAASLVYYQIDCPKAALPPHIREILVRYSENGVWSRQELGSMLPVAALAAVGAFGSSTQQRSDRDNTSCLDVCASPGSKTLQAWEQLLLLKQQQQQAGQKKRKRAGGGVLLVANDILASRLTSLKDAVGRSGVPGTQKIQYTNQDATSFLVRATTTLTKPSNNAHPTEAVPLASSSTSPPLLLFDVILCDVPCSGDGTCRKDKHVLPQWKPSVGNALHATQVKILTRACQLLSPGGYVCYSTCSLNPIENEAVVSAILQQKNHQMELVPCPELPGVTLRDGVSDWKVADYSGDAILPHVAANTASDGNTEGDDHDNKDGDDDSGSLLTWYPCFEDAVAARSASSTTTSWQSTMWPPTSRCDRTVQRPNLSLCKRLWPQDQDSGGFFLALLRKKTSS